MDKITNLRRIRFMAWVVAGPTIILANLYLSTSVGLAFLIGYLVTSEFISARIRKLRGCEHDS